jgi:hypothetical protein
MDTKTMLQEHVVVEGHREVDTLKDSEFKADAAKGRLDIEPVSGEEVEKIVHGLFKLEPSLINRLKEVLYK